MMRLPLGQWTLCMSDPPARLMQEDAPRAFSLPGADQLLAFADLLGEGEEKTENQAQETGVPYAPSGLFEDDLCGKLSLKKEIDFGLLQGDRAVLIFEHIAGRGEILLGDEVIARFDSLCDQTDALLGAFESTGLPCRLAVDVTQALYLGRKEKLEIRFDDLRPAGLCGAVLVHTSVSAHLSRVSIQPDAKRKIMTVRARISAHQKGDYALRVQAVPPQAGKAPAPAREIEFSLEKGGEEHKIIAMEVQAPRFVPHEAYAAPALRIELFARGKSLRGEGFLCDETLLLCGYGAAAPKAFLPLNMEDCMGDCHALCERLRALRVPAVYLGAPAPDALYRAFCREGMPVMQHTCEELRPALTRYPCVTLCDAPVSGQALSLQAAAWQMAGSIAFPRTVDETLTPQEMLLEISGMRLDADSGDVLASLSWLRAVQIRLRCEAARQGRYQGALCSAQEIEHKDVCNAIKTAFAPVHLSALPLSGAWWTGTRFSASLEAFLSGEMCANNDVCAMAALEDETGKTLARFETTCKKSDYIGVIEAQLPLEGCVLTLHTRLLCGEEILEESELPVYVGERAPLEAAF